MEQWYPNRHAEGAYVIERALPPQTRHSHNPILQEARDAVAGLEGDAWFAKLVEFYDGLDDHVGRMDHIRHADNVLWGLIDAYMHGYLRREWWQT